MLVKIARQIMNSIPRQIHATFAPETFLIVIATKIIAPAAIAIQGIKSPLTEHASVQRMSRAARLMPQKPKAASAPPVNQDMNCMKILIMMC